ncbi:hypothetical protein H2201_003418 [Coniosporium apollinis]|uniref:Uncharacterized protein n=1 Tax=Coniosporium apollinis TaxID=61459 RepID=A0ABQ9NVR4_9PEZI|nr:hypothetical protein H2201_003418 [Coniosporium apollinis]
MSAPPAKRKRVEESTSEGSTSEGLTFDEALSTIIELYGPMRKAVKCFDEDAVRSLLLQAAIASPIVRKMVNGKFDELRAEESEGIIDFDPTACAFGGNSMSTTDEDEGLRKSTENWNLVRVSPGTLSEGVAARSYSKDKDCVELSILDILESMEDPEIAAIPQDFINKVRKVVERGGRDGPRVLLPEVLSFFEAHGRAAEVEDQNPFILVVMSAPPAKRQRAGTLDEPQTNLRQRDPAMAIGALSEDTVRKILLDAAYAHPTVQSMIDAEYNALVAREQATMVNFDHFSGSIWKKLNIDHRHESGSRQYQSAGPAYN